MGVLVGDMFVNVYNGPIHAAQGARTGTNMHVPTQDREACLQW